MHIHTRCVCVCKGAWLTWEVVSAPVLVWMLEGSPTRGLLLGAGGELFQLVKLLLELAATEPGVVGLQLCECRIQLSHLHACRSAG